MPQNHPATAQSKAVIAKLAEPRRIEGLHPIAARFIYSLRLIALHERARRDPVPELASRLGRVETAAKSLALGHAISATWPENIHVSRFCCGLLSHDEAAIGALVDSAVNRDRAGFEGVIEGLIRPDRTHRLWDAVLGLVVAEMRER
ncbi:MAG: DNA-directed RNA polymerase subunit beta' [Erythrobacter sp.]